MKILTFSLALIIVAATVVASVGAADCAPGAKSAILIDAATEKAIFEKNAGERLPMASTTKIMTALVAIDNLPLDRVVTAKAEGCGIEGSSIWMREGDKYTTEELLFALMLQSANDAAAQLALECSGSIEGFAELMNEKAAALGLTDTHFANPHGLDDDAHYTTARDLAILAATALKDPTFSAICSTYRRTIGSGECTRTLVNHNRLLVTYEGAVGMKTGFTKKSGRCLVSAATRGGVTLVAVTLDDPDDWRDHAALLDLGFSQIEAVSLCKEGGITLDLPCTGGSAESVKVSNRDALSVDMRKGHGEVSVTVYAPHFLFAPVNAGDAVGTAVFICGGREVGRCALYAESASEYKKQKGFFERLFDLYR